MCLDRAKNVRSMRYVSKVVAVAGAGRLDTMRNRPGFVVKPGRSIEPRLRQMECCGSQVILARCGGALSSQLSAPEFRADS
jgi:hypothetical protein